MSDFYDISNVDGKYIFSSPEIIVEVGDTKQEDFYPQTKLIKWNNEVNFSIRFTDNLEDSSNTIDENGVVTWVGKDDIEIKMYGDNNVNPSDIGFEYEIKLPYKPSFNTFEMTIRTKNISLIYNPEISDEQAQRLIDNRIAAEQPTPTLEEAKRIIRPEIIVGSYAVYYNLNKNDKYRSGKAFHIYRPKAVDSENNETWCEMNIDIVNEIMTISVPQDFIDSAVYPVIIDPTFGNTSIGGSWYEYVNGQGFAGIYTSNDTTYIDSLVFYAKRTYAGGTTPNLKGVIWGGGTPPAAILTNGVDGSVAVTNTTGDWYTVRYNTKPSVSNGTAYRLGAICDQNFSSASIAYDGNVEIDPNNYATPEAYEPFTSEPTFQPSVYATYFFPRNGFVNFQDPGIF